MKAKIAATVIHRQAVAAREAAQTKINEWAEMLAKNPIHALEWSDNTYVYAARVEYAGRMADLVEYGQGREQEDATIYEECVKHARREMVRLARTNSSHSTSQGHNLLDAARVTVAAEWLEYLE